MNLWLQVRGDGEKTQLGSLRSTCNSAVLKMDNYCIAQAAQSCVATWMGGGTGEDGHMYMYS